MVDEQTPDSIKKEISRLRSEVRNLAVTKKEISAFSGVSNNYWTMTGMPWASGDGRKAVLTEYFWQPIRGQPRRVDTNELRQFAQTYWVNACVKTLVDEISTLDWDVIPKDEYEYEWVKTEIETVKKFLMKPNKNSEGFQDILKPFLKDVLEIDAGVWVKVFTLDSYDFDMIEPKSGAPMLKPKGQRKMTEVYARDGASFLKEIDKFGFLKGYWQYSYQIPAHPMWFNEEEIVYTMESPRSMSCYGYARTQAVLDIVKSLHYSTLYNKRFFEESPIPDGALSLLDTNEVEMTDFMNYWNTEFKAQPHKVAILNKDVKWQPFNITNRELEFLETQKWYMNMIVSEYGLSMEELGITEDSNRATSATQAELVKRRGIRPFLKVIENAINRGILPEFDFEGIEFTFIYDDPAEKKAKLDNWKLELDMGVKTINEVRNELGLEPIEGGDVSNNMMSRMMFQTPGSQNNTQEMGEDAAEQRQGRGYADTLRRQENKPDDKADRDKNIRNPHGQQNRPMGNFKMYKRAYELMSLDELIAEHRKLVQILSSGSDEEQRREGEDQKRELEEYIRQRREKGFDDGQYYREQPIAMPRRPSGADFQPQNPEPFRPENQRNTLTDTNPSVLSASHADPVRDRFRSPDLVNCPICGQASLAALETETVMVDDYRCTNCGARMNSKDLLSAPVMEEIHNALQQYNVSNPVVIPEWKPKSADIMMSVKEYCGFDIGKSANYIVSMVESPGYRAVLKKYLGDLPLVDVDKIIKLLKAGLSGNMMLREVGRKIGDVLGDPARGDIIARTEIIRLSNEGNLSRMESKGTEMVEFIAAPEDGRLCKKCAGLDGVKYRLENARGVIPVHPRCRCTFTEYYGG